MITYYVGAEEVLAYCRDLFYERLSPMGADFPTLWVTIGESGLKLAEKLYSVMQGDRRIEEIELAPMYFDRETEEIKLGEGVSFDSVGRHASVLLIDFSVHTGRSLIESHATLVAAGAANIMTYGLAVKRGSRFIPNYFGVLISDEDRVILDRASIPNNRLIDSSPLGVLSFVDRRHLKRGLEGMPEPLSKVTIGDLLYNWNARSCRSYLYEISNVIAAFISFEKQGDILFLDALAVRDDYQKRGIAGALVRWSETWARAEGCKRSRLLAYKPAVNVYKKFGYRIISNSEIDIGDSDVYFLMERDLNSTMDRGL